MTRTCSCPSGHPYHNRCGSHEPIGAFVGGDFKKHLNPHSLEVVTAKCEPSLKDAKPELHYQFERLGYFTLDKDSSPAKLVLNRTITLKDAWAKEAKKG